VGGVHRNGSGAACPATSGEQVKNMIIDVTTGHVYSALSALAPITGTALNPVAAHGMCQEIGFYTVEYMNSTEWLEHSKTHMELGLMMVGGYRQAGALKWRSNNAAISLDTWWSEGPVGAAVPAAQQDDDPPVHAERCEPPNARERDRPLLGRQLVYSARRHDSAAAAHVHNVRLHGPRRLLSSEWLSPMTPRRSARCK
jgi:hypothetical protein